MLILDSSSNDAEQTINILRNSGHPVRATQIVNEEDLEVALEKQSWDLFIVRDEMNQPNAEQCVKIVQHYGSDIPFIMTTSNYSVHRTLEAMRLGMKDVVPEDNDEYFKLVVERELSSIEDRRVRKLADNTLRETVKRNELLLDNSRDAIAYMTDGMHIYANRAYMELFGYDDPDELECMPIMDLIDTKQHGEFKKYLKSHSNGKASEDFEFTGLNTDGKTFEAFLSLTDSKYDGEDCTLVYIQIIDATDAQLEKKLQELSILDRLTGLYNQHYFIECLTESISKAASDNQLSAIFYMELDNFDSIQNEHGIKNTDLYLKEVSQWFTNNLSSGTILARIGDCTFVMLTNISKPTEAETIAAGLCKKFSSHMFEASAHTITDSLSIGICPVQETSPDADKILSNAHFASSRVQSKGGNGSRLHDNSLDSLDNRDEAQTAMELQDAMDAGLIKVMYEPIVKLHGTVQQMFHAKLEIETEQGQNKPIFDVYQVGDRTKTASKLDNWLMTQSFKAFTQYQSNHADCKLKIPLCAASLLDDRLISNICDLLSQHNLPEQAVIFEFKEDDMVTYLKRAIQLFNEMGQKDLISALSGFGNTLDSKSILESINCKSLSWISIEATLLNNFISDAEAQEKIAELISFANANDLTTITPAIVDPGCLATIWPMNVGHIHGEYIASATITMDFDFSEAAF